MSPVIYWCRKLHSLFCVCLSLLFTVVTSTCLFVPGSTDCICFATVGTNDPVTSALHIIVGESHGVTTHHLVTKTKSKPKVQAYSVKLEDKEKDLIHSCPYFV